MTSVTLPSSSAPLNGGYSSLVTEEISPKADFDTLRTIKRSLSLPSSESCKKRRKQSTPTRILTGEHEQDSVPVIFEGKPVVPSSEENVRCPICQIFFDHPERLHNHLNSDHSPLKCKTEPEEHSSTPLSISFLEQSEASVGLSIRPEIKWNDIHNKEWMSSSLTNLPFNPSNNMFMSFPLFSQQENIPPKPIRIFNPDAYCDLCNKEFCNKYFLKTHKANKHGISTDNSSNEPSLTVSSATRNIKLPNMVPTPDSTTTKNEINIINPLNNIFSNMFSNQASLSDDEINENVAISNDLPTSTERGQILLGDQPAEEYTSPNNTLTESTSIKNDPDEFFNETSGKLSSDVPNRDLDLSYRLRNIGVMNPKAFCEICCKEYCNKYFLRTHKLKRHGIYIQDEREKDIRTVSVVNFSLLDNVQTSPLNLIMTEQSSFDNKTTSPSGIRCDICCITFQNENLAQLHNISFHGKLHSKELLDSTKNSNKLPNFSKTIEKSLNAEAISEDLQKLQTMILQLNDLDSNTDSRVCNICNKEFESRFYLTAHMVSEHGLLLDEVGDVEKPGERKNTLNNNTMCDICGKEVRNGDEMTRHIMEFHSNNLTGVKNNKEECNGYRSGDKVTSRISISTEHITERRISINVTPTSSYCEICNKELCNKYFMKTHMQRMHGIEIENGAHIGGVVCDICNKELCSKYFLRVHKHNTHGIIEYGTNLLPPRQLIGEAPSLQQVSSEVDPALKPCDLADLSHRYFTHFTEVCAICSRRFRSTKWLKAHLVSDHGHAGADKWEDIDQLQKNCSATKFKNFSGDESSQNMKIPNDGQEETQSKVGIQSFISSLFGTDETNSKMYQCSYCPFSSPLLPLLFVHERSHTLHKKDTRCPICLQNFVEIDLQHHLFSQHPFLLSTLGPEEDYGPKKYFEETSKSVDTNNISIKTESKTNQNEEKQNLLKHRKPSSSSTRMKKIELTSDILKSLKDVARKIQWPATYAIPQCQNITPDEQDQEESLFTQKAEYVMQAFLLEESTSERRVMPSVVFLPMLQKQPAPITVTFTLTPA